MVGDSKIMAASMWLLILSLPTAYFLALVYVPYKPETRLRRRMVMALVMAGLVMAAIGLIDRSMSLLGQTWFLCFSGNTNEGWVSRYRHRRLLLQGRW